MVKSFQELNKHLLYVINKIVRYRHHIVFIKTYRKLKCVPKGFVLKFHSNLPGLDMSTILKKSSMKLMEKTLTYYTVKVKEFETLSWSLATEIMTEYPDRHLYVRNLFKNRFESLSPLIQERRERKFVRDAVPLDIAINHSQNLIKSFKIIIYSISKEKTSNPSDTHHPIIITKDPVQISNSFKDLCSKGPSFVPTPEHFD